MVDSKSTELKENDDFKSDFESDKNKIDSKDEASLSFYECPTAAASIQAFTEENRYITTSLDSEQDFTYYDGVGKTDLTQLSINTDNNFSDLGPTSSDGGSVSTSQLTKARGGYFAGYQAVLYEGNPTLKNRPENFFDENSLKLAEHDLSYVKAGRPDFNYIQMNTNFNVSQAPSGPNTEYRPQSNTLSFGPNYTFAPNPVYQPSFVPQLNTAENNIPFTVTSVRSECSNVNDFAKTSRNPCSVTPSMNFGHSALVPSIPEVVPSDSSSASGKASTLSYIPEGFETIAVPKYRPIELVEKTIEVPVVHHIDTFVPKKEIQEIDTYVKKPFTKYVDRVVEVPQVHYTDKIVEVPEYHEITKTVPKVEVQEKTNYVPKVEVKVVPKYVEVPVVKIVDKYEEYEQVEEVVKHVEKVEVVEVPKEVVKTVVKPVRKIVEKEKIVPVYEHRDVPVEKIKYVPKIETVEHLREVPKVVDVPVPYNVPKHQFVDQPYVVPKYRDVPVAVPVAKSVKPVFEDKGPVNYIDVPVHKPYFVIHDHLNFKPVDNFNSNAATNPFQAQPGANQFASANFNVNTTAGNTVTTQAGNPTFGVNNPAVTNTTFGGFSQASGVPGQFNVNQPFNNSFAGANNFNLGAEFKNFEDVSYRVVGMNRLDLDKMPPEERQRAQQKLNEALEDPNFEVYKKSLDPAFNASQPNATPYFNSNFNVPINAFQAHPGTNQFASAPNVNGFNGQFNKNGVPDDFKPNPVGFNKPATNFGPGFGNWDRWNHAEPHSAYPNSNGAFQNNVNPNLNTNYKYDPSYSNSFFSWTDKLFRFFTGSKTPTPANATHPFPNAGQFGPNKAAHTSQPNTRFNEPNSGASRPNFVPKPNYGLQDSFRSFHVPNLNVDLEKNTPTNKMFFQETENPYASGSTGQYYVSSGSGSVGHRVSQSFDRPPVYPPSGPNTPSVH